VPVVISEEDVNRALKQGTGFTDGKLRIAVLYEREASAKNRAQYLKEEYGIGGRSFELAQNVHGYVNYDSKGIALEVYHNHLQRQLTWTEAEKRIHLLIHNGQYLFDRRAAANLMSCKTATQME